MWDFNYVRISSSVPCGHHNYIHIYMFDIFPNWHYTAVHDPKCLINPVIYDSPFSSPLCINLLKPESSPSSPGFEKNRFVDVWPSAAWLCPSDATIHTRLYRAGHDGQDTIQKVRKALFIYGGIVMHTILQMVVFNCISSSYLVFILMLFKTANKSEDVLKKSMGKRMKACSVRSG